MRPPYSKTFREKMVQRMIGPGALTATQLAKQVGVTQPTLSKWRREAHRAAMTPKTKAPERPAPSGPPKTAEDKLRLVLAAEQLAPAERGAFLLRGAPRVEELDELLAVRTPVRVELLQEALLDAARFRRNPALVGPEKWREGQRARDRNAPQPGTRRNPVEVRALPRTRGRYVAWSGDVIAD
ncbi:transposase [Sorangium sp. So ce1153]|uniref:transposase n=1 Tax=Sorangium sp. So ce1153 TaxID=3133333 RepID=UPI003F624A97